MLSPNRSVSNCLIFWSLTICVSATCQQNADEKALASNRLLCIFTTFKPGRHKYPVYVNTLRNWKLLDANEAHCVQPILYDTSSDYSVNGELTNIALSLGWSVWPATKVSKLGVPFLKDMYLTAARRLPNCQFYAYSNGDIIYSYDLIRTLESVQRAIHKPTMVIGRRMDVDITENELYFPSDVKHAATNGTLHSSYGKDYFLIAENKFPWDKVPKIVIGRPNYDNFMVALASLNKLAVVDATSTITAVHQTDKEGVGAGHRRPGNTYNKRVINRLAANVCQQTTCTEYVTAFVRISEHEEKVKVSRR